MIRIEDLARPRLTETQRAALSYAEQHPVELTERAVLERAVERTGLDDFGPDGFRERLRLWLDEIDSDADRTALGRATTFASCVRYASNRLRIHDLLTKHPEIHEQEIRAPIVVAGLPRSGTTHLLNLMAADRRLRSLPLWKAMEPVPPSGEDRRRDRCARDWERTKLLLPHLAAMHPMEPDHIHEEIELQLPDFASYTLEWVARVPRWRDHYLSHDQTPHYTYMRTVLQILQWLEPGPDRWVFKSPQHMEQLGPLLATFPDAIVVCTHRDPLDVIASAATMQAYAARLHYRRTEPGWYVTYWTDRIERLLRSFVRDATDDLIHVPFDEILADDVGVVRRIFRTAGLPPDDDARDRVHAHSAAHPRPRIAYEPLPDGVRDRFSFYAWTTSTA